MRSSRNSLLIDTTYSGNRRHQNAPKPEFNDPGLNAIFCLGGGQAYHRTVEQFQKLNAHLKEPFTTMALVSVCLGLRVSELLALKWKDVDWLNASLNIERGIVKQIVDDVKTDSSRKSLTIDKALPAVLKVWKQTTQFPANEDWIFASPLKLGRLPYSYTGFWRELERATKVAGIGHLGTHVFRHTFRSWLDAVGTSVAVQQKLMRHSDIRTTMNIYGDVVTDEMGHAQTDCRPG